MSLDDVRSAPRARLALLIVGCVPVALVGALALQLSSGMRAQADRQAMIREHRSAVMPFDLDRTTHVFNTIETGVVEAVTAKDPADSRQIALIQQHLQHEALRFGAGDFGDPAAIHGADMPGLAELAAGAANITFSYAALPAGAQISYETTDPRLIDALHRWFAAQLADHGHDAMGQ